MDTEKQPASQAMEKAQLMNHLLQLIDEYFSCVSIELCETDGNLRLISEMGNDIPHELEAFLTALRVDHEMLNFVGSISHTSS